MKDWVGNFVSNGLKWGKNLVRGIADGILSGVKWVKDAVVSVAGGIKKFLGFSSPTEEGPGSESDKWMPNLINMLKKGLKKELPGFNAILNTALNPSFNYPAVNIDRDRGPNYGININVTGNYVRNDDDIDKIASQIVKKLKLKGVTV